MKKIYLLLITVFFIVLKISASDITYETSDLKISLNDKGYVVGIFDKQKKAEYLANDQMAPLLSIRVNNVFEHPNQLLQKNDVLTLSFSKNKVQVEIRVITKLNYISFELIGITKNENIELIVWGPYPTKISETIGECVGVVRNNQFAIGIQSLNVKTLGGYPSEENDIEPAFDIFATDNIVDLSADWKKKKHYRGQTAKVQDFGSVLQAYCRNRNKRRIIANWA